MEASWLQVDGGPLPHVPQLGSLHSVDGTTAAVDLGAGPENVAQEPGDNAKRKREHADGEEDVVPSKDDPSQAQAEPTKGLKKKRGPQPRKRPVNGEEGSVADAVQTDGQKKAPMRRSKRQKAHQDTMVVPQEGPQFQPDQGLQPPNATDLANARIVINENGQHQDPLSGLQVEHLHNLEHALAHNPNASQDQLQHEAQHLDQKYSSLQIKAWIASGQPLDLPGYQWPGPLPHVQMGARWQLDLRTGERLEDHNSAQLNMNHLATLQGQHPNAFTVHNAALAAQALGTRNLQWNGGHQGGATQGYGLSQAMYPAPFGLPGSSHQAAQGFTGSNGSYSAMLAPQILAAQGLIAQHNQAGSGSMGNLPALQHLVGAGNTRPNDRRHRSISELEDSADPPDIPLRRRGRPAGDGSGTAASPQELLERRMQANRAAASRSHFRRKREMELLDKECAITEARIQELRMGLTALMQQEEQLRMQQQTIRSQLAAGIKPDDSLSLPQFLPHQPLTHEPPENAHDLHHQMILQ